MTINLLAFTTDHEMLTRLSSLAINGQEITIYPASTLEELHDAIGQQHVDAALIDISSGEFSLQQLIGELTGQQPGIRILVSSADKDVDSLHREGDANYNLITSPFTDEDLATALEELLTPLETTEDENPASADAKTDDEPQVEEDHEPSLIEIIDAAVFETEEAEKSQDVLDSTGDEAQDPSVISTLSQPDPGSISNEQADPVPAQISALRLSYTCVLVPRHPRQYLARDLADRAASILPQLHLSRGWRVTGISVRPQYLQWVIALPVDTCPVEAIQDIRQRTSVHFYTHFPELAPAGQNHDFWAPGYLMMSGSQPISTAIIRAFIQRVHTSLLR